MNGNLLEVENIDVVYGDSPILRGVSLYIGNGEIVGIAGESGSGKSTLIYSVLGMLGHNGVVSSGSVFFDGSELTKLSVEEMRQLRGSKLALIAQNPMQSFHPIIKIKDQLLELVNSHKGLMTYSEAEERMLALLKNMRITDGRRILNSYAFELSGGMCQRASIAMAMVLNPKLILADEPTSALDVTVQAQVVEELMKLRGNYGSSVLVVSHNMGVIAHIADKIVIMFSGRVLEYGEKQEIIKHPRHPYTINLLKSVPRLNAPLPMKIKTYNRMPEATGCPLYGRCDRAQKRCRDESPEETMIANGHMVRCWYV